MAFVVTRHQLSWNVLQSECFLQVYSLPDLQPKGNTLFKELTCWSWNWDRAVLPCSNPALRCAACATTGLISLVGPCQELVLMRVGPQGPKLARCNNFFDPDLASAAYSAQCKDSSRRSTTDRRSPGRSESPQVLSGLLRTVDRTLKGTLTDQGWLGEPEASPERRVHMRPGSHLLPLFNCATGAGIAAGATTSGLAAPKESIAHPGRGLRGDPSWPRPAPAAVAALPPPPASPRAERRPAPTAADVAKSDNAVLTRSATEIRQAYGRPSERDPVMGAVAGTAEVMRENVARLQDRGERLQGLERKMEDLNHEAASFAAMSKKLEQGAKKPWWSPF
jgi:hypothetical protein